MARLRATTQEFHENVAAALGDFLTSGQQTLFGAKPDAPLMVESNFPLMKFDLLGAHSSASQGRDISTFMEDTGYQVYQVRNDEVPLGLAVAHEDDPSKASIDAFKLTREAVEVSQALTRAEELALDDTYEATMLDLATQNLAAIVLIADGDQPSFAIPFRVPVNQQLLHAGRAYSSDDFLAAVRELPVSSGLALDEPTLDHHPPQRRKPGAAGAA
ncbi:hypothetical protein [Pseudoxanthomonas wuyuanensis]